MLIPSALYGRRGTPLCAGHTATELGDILSAMTEIRALENCGECGANGADFKGVLAQFPCIVLVKMRTTRKVSVWPVGLVGGRRYERPLVENGKVVGWYTGWRADRPFAIDMADYVIFSR
ncbi:hypothetical protein CB1_000550010 [Camelus ferus]|nr:hypothetical protein CB1_000550010 [Camelus ferus]